MSASRDAGVYLRAYEEAFRAWWCVGRDIVAVRDAAEEWARQCVANQATDRRGRRWFHRRGHRGR